MRFPSRAWLFFGGFGWCLGAIVFAAASACGTSANGVDTCRTLEEARCHRAPGCMIDLTDPVHRDGTDVSSCVRFYDTQCLHGLETSITPSDTQIDQCLQAINQASCDIVITPQDDPRCEWLIPSEDAGTDADADADASDADSDADTDADAN